MHISMSNIPNFLEVIYCIPIPYPGISALHPGNNFLPNNAPKFFGFRYVVTGGV